MSLYIRQGVSPPPAPSDDAASCRHGDHRGPDGRHVDGFVHGSGVTLTLAVPN